MTPDTGDRLQALIHDALDEIAAGYRPVRPQPAVRHRVRAAARARRRRAAMLALVSLSSAAAAIAVAGVLFQPASPATDAGRVRMQPAIPSRHGVVGPVDLAPQATVVRLGAGDTGRDLGAEAGSTLVVQLADSPTLHWTDATSSDPRVLAVVSVQHAAGGLLASFHTSGTGSALLQARASSACSPEAPQKCTQNPVWSVQVNVFAMSGGTAARPG